VRGKLIGFVFQSYQLIPTLTALENVLLPHELNVSARELCVRASSAKDLLAAVGLPSGRPPPRAASPGGEQQRVARPGPSSSGPSIVLAMSPLATWTPRTA